MATKVTVNTELNKVVINSEPAKVVTVNQPSGSQIVKVISQGPKGDKGDPGEISGVYSGIFQITGSLEVSGSGITGSLFGTSSWAQNASTASYVLASSVQGLNLSQITSGSGTASITPTQFTVNVDSQITGSLDISDSLYVHHIYGDHGTEELTLWGDRDESDYISIVSVAGAERVIVGVNEFESEFQNDGTFQTQGNIKIPTGSRFIGTASWAENSLTASYVLASSVQGLNLSQIASGSGTASITSTEFSINVDTDITGSLTVTNGITGSLYGTASWAENALTSSYAIAAANASTASYVEYNNVGNKPTLFSGSSQVQLNQITGATFADTLYTFPGDLTVQGNITAEQLIISTSVYFVTTSFSSGSTIFGNSVDDTHQFTGSVRVNGSISGSLFGTSSWAITASNALTASYALNAGNAIFTQTGSFYSTTNNIVITGSSPLLSSPDGTVTDKYAFEVSQSIWANNINAGYPTSNPWQTSLNGSYFNNFNQNTDVSEILRFIAGLLSSSAPDASPNTKTYSTFTANAFSTTTGTVTAGSIPQSSTNSTIVYLNSKGFANAGSTIFAGISPIYTTGLYSQSYTSVAAGTTAVSSSVDTQLFGLGLLSSGTPTNFSVSGSFVFRFKDNSSKTDTATSSSIRLITQTGAGTTNGVSLAKINTINPAVIPAAYQDGKFANVFSPAIFSGSSAPAVSSSGYYHISTSISIASSSGNFSTPISVNTEIFSAPLTTISTNVPANTITSTNAVTASLTAASRSLSGAPYLTGATYTVSSSITGAFNPLYFAGAGIATQTTSGTGITQTSGVTTVSTAGGLVSTANAVFDSTGVTARATSTIPFETDTIKLNGLYTFAAGTNTNIAQSSITPLTFTVTTNATNKNSSTTGYNTQTINYFTSGAFGKTAASGSMAYWNGGANAPTTLIEYFNSESFRRVVSDYTTLTTTWNQSSYLTLGDTGSLQVKPGFLVNPESTDGYWYPTSGYNSGHYKWYLREFDTAAVANRTTLTITLLPASSADLVDFSTTTADKISVGVIFQATSGTVFDAVKGNGSYGGSLNSQAKGFLNPFSSNINVVGDFSTFSNSNGTLTLGLNNVIGQIINAANPKIWLLIRYKGKPTNALTRITVSTA